MTSVKMSVKEKRDRARRSILDAAEVLFYENGYSETSIKDIIREAGILNGSLYNRFKNKEEILLSILSDVFEEVLSHLDKELENETDPRIILIFPSSLEVFFSSRSYRFARLFYQCHCTWSAVMELSKYTCIWSEKHLSHCNLPEVDEETKIVKTTILLGAVGNACGHYSNGGTADYRDFLKDGVTLLSSLFDLPMDDVDSVVIRITELLDTCDLGRYEGLITR